MFCLEPFLGRVAYKFNKEIINKKYESRKTCSLLVTVIDSNPYSYITYVSARYFRYNWCFHN